MTGRHRPAARRCARGSLSTSRARPAISGGPTGRISCSESPERVRRTCSARSSRGRVTHRRISHDASSVPATAKATTSTNRSVRRDLAVDARSSAAVGELVDPLRERSEPRPQRVEELLPFPATSTAALETSPDRCAAMARSADWVRQVSPAETTRPSGGRKCGLVIGDCAQRAHEALSTSLPALNGSRNRSSPVSTKPPAPVSWSEYTVVSCATCSSAIASRRSVRGCRHDD